MKFNNVLLAEIFQTTSVYPGFLAATTIAPDGSYIRHVNFRNLDHFLCCNLENLKKTTIKLYHDIRLSKILDDIYLIIPQEILMYWPDIQKCTSHSLFVHIYGRHTVSKVGHEWHCILLPNNKSFFILWLSWIYNSHRCVFKFFHLHASHQHVHSLPYTLLLSCYTQRGAAHGVVLESQTFVFTYTSHPSRFNYSLQPLFYI